MHVVRFRTAGSIRIFEHIATVGENIPLVLCEDILERLHTEVTEYILLVVAVGEIVVLGGIGDEIVGLAAVDAIGGVGELGGRSCAVPLGAAIADDVVRVRLGSRLRDDLLDGIVPCVDVHAGACGCDLRYPPAESVGAVLRDTHACVHDRVCLGETIFRVIREGGPEGVAEVSVGVVGIGDGIHARGSAHRDLRILVEGIRRVGYRRGDGRRGCPVR